MKLRDSFDGSNRFEGDRVLRWRSIPADARIVSAKATVTPADANLGSPFAELLTFNDGTTREFGATKAQVGTWVEVDFHKRRTLASVVGSNLNPTTLQVDLGGGAYVEINKAGALKTPDPPPNNFFTLTDDSSPLPGLTVSKFKLTSLTLMPDLTSVTVRSVPTNVSLRLGELPPFWTHLGEMTQPETTPDFTAVLRAALLNTKIENGFYDLPLVIHSDTIARLQVDLEIEFLAQQDPLPNGLQEVVLPFDFSTLSQSTAATLNVAVPPNTRVVPGQTSARVRGNFAETRIAYGPTGDVKPVAAVEVSPASSQAQIIALDKDTAATAIDLLLESTTLSARLGLDVRGDLDGKPDDTSLLTAPVEISVDQQAGKGARWTSAQLPAEFVFSRAQSESAPGLLKRYWLVLQSLEGTAAWSVDKAVDKTKDKAEDKAVDKAAPGALNMQATRDGSLSWRDTIAMANTLIDQTIAASGPFTAFFRLRSQPKTFKVPIELQAGRDKTEVRIKLDRFQPLGRVDFLLDTELAQGINDSLAKAPSATGPDTEHLHNRYFEQWLRVGDDINAQPEITLDQLQAPISAVAFAPDGTLAYVLGRSLRSESLLVIDVPCNRVKEKRIALSISNPGAFVISPDGTRAYVIDNGNLQKLHKLQVVNLVTNEVLGVPFDLAKDPTSERSANALALSPDGARLYVAIFDSSVTKNRIRVIDTVKLEQQLTTGATVMGIVDPKPVDADNAQTLSPKALAVSPDGSLLYMVTDRGTDTPEVRTVDTNTFVLLTQPIGVGHAPTVNTTPTALALSLDGTRLVVTIADDNNVSVIDTATGIGTPVNVSTQPIGVAVSPIGVAVSPDGTRAYVLNQTDESISTVDLSRQVVLKDPIPLSSGITPVALALAPRGDKIYVANRISAGASAPSTSISSIQFGTRLPSEWHLTSGEVTPFCLDPPFHLVAILGSDTMSTGLSQVVPVAESSPYEFSFWGIAREPDTNEPPAVAEVLWLGGDCGLLRTDPVPIKLLGVRPAVNPLTGLSAALFSPGAAGRTASLELHRVRLMAPAGASQAEVRFTVPSGGAAAIDQVSLITTSEAAANADLKLQQDGRLADWALSPEFASGFNVFAADDGIQLRNSGAALIELVQVAAAKSGQPFTLNFQGKAVSGSSPQTNPRVELRWLKADGTSTGSPTIIEILPNGLASSVAAGTAPADSTQVEIHLGVPAGATLEVKRVSLRFSTPTIVPVTFIAEAPGEMTVSGVRVAFDHIEPTAPPIPARGLCIPTPPGRQPGETGDDSCFCHHCESEQTMVEAQSVVTPAGLPAMMGTCANCRGELLRGGGPGIPGAQPLLLTRPPVPGPIVIRSPTMTGETARFHVEAAAPQLTELRGIGKARAKQLVAIGIDSVEKLAASAPATVAQIRFITVEMATLIIEEAKSLIGGSIS
jgi:DNA-binding beta-propeller fold protein YncE